MALLSSNFPKAALATRCGSTCENLLITLMMLMVCESWLQHFHSFCSHAYWLWLCCWQQSVLIVSHPLFYLIYIERWYWKKYVSLAAASSLFPLDSFSIHGNWIFGWYMQPIALTVFIQVYCACSCLVYFITEFPSNGRPCSLLHRRTTDFCVMQELFIMCFRSTWC